MTRGSVPGHEAPRPSYADHMRTSVVMPFQPVIIIGAPRSGTNMLRDVLCRLAHVGTWPCDEINYIWRYGNAHWPSDELPPDLATERVSHYIRRQFAKRAARDRLDYVVEKTCANSLRIPFVARVLPQARYLFIYRDALDAVASAAIRWHSPLDLGYTIRKARFVPPGDFPYYLRRFCVNRLARLRSSDRRLAIWGPRMNDMEAVSRGCSVEEICARQWSACVEKAVQDLRRLPADAHYSVAYEDFVRDPAVELARLCRFLGIGADASQCQAAVSDVTAGSIGKGRGSFEPHVASQVSRLTAPGREAIAALTAAVRR